MFRGLVQPYHGRPRQHKATPTCWKSKDGEDIVITLHVKKNCALNRNYFSDLWKGAQVVPVPTSHVQGYSANQLIFSSWKACRVRNFVSTKWKTLEHFDPVCLETSCSLPLLTQQASGGGAASNADQCTKLGLDKPQPVCLSSEAEQQAPGPSILVSSTCSIVI